MDYVIRDVTVATLNRIRSVSGSLPSQFVFYGWCQAVEAVVHAMTPFDIHGCECE